MGICIMQGLHQAASLKSGCIKFLIHRLNFQRLNFERPNFDRTNFERLNFKRPNFERLNFEKDSTSKRTQLRTTQLRMTELRKGPNIECDSTSNFELRTSKNVKAYINLKRHLLGRVRLG
jgi:uncharacterized protein YjbI with pentapeptide repeats